MSQENVDLVRRLYEESYRTRNIESTRDSVSEEFRFHTRPEWPGRAVYGRDEMPEVWADLDETFSEYSLVPQEFEHLGDYVLVTLNVSASFRQGEIRLEEALYHLWKVREGKAIEAWTYGEKDEALEAVGLRE